jgi:negative regulator of sigma E activity
MINQKLSALLDGELNSDEMRNMFDAVLNDSELRHSWRCQHLLRNALRDKEVASSSNIAEKVSAALENEPTIFVPGNLPYEEKQPEIVSHGTNNVVQMPSKRMNMLAYVAIAASVAAIVMVSFSPDRPSVPTIADSTQSSTPDSMAVEQELQSMIVQHGEFSGTAALNGLTAYAKVVNGSRIISR